MNTKKIFLYIVSGLLMVGCSDLDTAPMGSTITSKQKDQVIESTPEKAEASVNAVFDPFKSYMPNYDALGGTARHNDFGYPSIMLFTDQNGYDMISSDNGYNWMGNNLEFYDRVYTSNECQIVWNDLYSLIYSSNNVIAALGEPTDAVGKYFLGQGLASRAFGYFVLAQLYQFNYVGNESKPCVPIITNENADDAALNGCPRSTVQEVYTLILTDINKAVTLLEEAEKGGKTRPDKRYISAAVAYGIRARINLTMQKWGEAASDATKAIEMSGATPASIEDVSKPSFWDMAEKNWMWGVKVEETDDVVSSGIVNWISHMGSLNYGYAWYSGGKQISKKLFNEIPATDVRKGWWVNEKIESPNIANNPAAVKVMKTYYGKLPYTQVKFAPYKEEVQTSTNANDIPLMRVEEMYLIKAEAEGMGGGNGKATLENFIKTYRNPEYTCSAASGAALQEEVYFHRRIELWGEGLIWFDIMRLNKGIDRRGHGFHDATMVFNIAPKDPILLWRIPEAEIQANIALSEEDNNPLAPLPTPVPDTK